MDPKYQAALERIATIYVTYLVMKYKSQIPWLDDIAVPDIIILGGGLVMGLYAFLSNTKAALIARAAKAAPTATINLSPRDPDSKAIAATTPDNVTVATH